MPRFSVAAIAASVLALALVPAAPAAPPGGLEITTLSGRADTVTGGDSLVRVDVPRAVPLHRVTVRLNGDDVTGAFVADPAARTLTGLVDGLRLGPNTLVAGAPGRQARLDVVNHPQEGPVFSGPHQQPFLCETAQFTVR